MRELIVKAVLKDLGGRRGFRHLLDESAQEEDLDAYEGMVTDLIDIVQKELEKPR